MMRHLNTYHAPTLEMAISTAIYGMFCGAPKESITIYPVDKPNAWAIHCVNQENEATIEMVECMNWVIRTYFDEEQHLDNLDIDHL